MKGKNSLLIAAVVYLVLGLILLVFPGATTTILCSAVGGLLLLYGGITIASFFIHKSSSHDFGLQAELLLGVIAAVVGLVFILKPALILSFLPIVLGVYILIDGLVNLKRGLDMRKMGYQRWTASLVLSVISLVLGAVILLDPFETHLMLLRVIGVAFLYQGASDLWAVLTLGKLVKLFSDK